MANYYTELSTVFLMPDAEQRAWAMGLANLLTSFSFEPLPDDADPEYVKLDEEFGEATGDEYMTISVDEQTAGRKNTHGLWIHESEVADAEHVVWFVQAIMRKFDIKEPFMFSWAETCDRPRAEAFGGGSAVVTKDESHWFIPEIQAVELIKQLSEKQVEPG